MYKGSKLLNHLSEKFRKINITENDLEKYHFE